MRYFCLLAKKTTPRQGEASDNHLKQIDKQTRRNKKLDSTMQKHRPSTVGGFYPTPIRICAYALIVMPLQEQNEAWSQKGSFTAVDDMQSATSRIFA
jgi:hypothetical protein